RILLAFPASGVRLAVGGEEAPDKHLAMNEKIVIENHRRTGHQERLLGSLEGSGDGNFLNKEIIIGEHGHGAAGILAPFVTQQFAAGCDFEIGLLAAGVGTSRLLELRLDDADAVELVDAEGLGNRSEERRV